MHVPSVRHAPTLIYFCAQVKDPLSICRKRVVLTAGKAMSVERQIVAPLCRTSSAANCRPKANCRDNAHMLTLSQNNQFVTLCVVQFRRLSVVLTWYLCMHSVFYVLKKNRVGIILEMGAYK